MPVRVVSTRDAQPITVNSLIANPLVIPERVVSAVRDQFVMERILRSGGKAPGAVTYRVSSGLFADQTSEVVNEGAEIPQATVTRGDIVSKPTQKRGLALVVTREMRDRDDMGEVNRQLDVITNTLVRDHDGMFVTTLRTAVTQTVAAATPWATSATIRKNINAARLLVTQATAPSAGAGSYMGFRPDTILISPTTEANLLNSTEFLALIAGQVNPTNISSLGDIPGGILGLTPLVSPSVADNEAFVLQARTVGFYADEVPLESTELYEWRPAQIWRSDTVRTTVAGIDQPLAAARITAI